MRLEVRRDDALVLIVAAMAALLAGCSSTPGKERIGPAFYSDFQKGERLAGITVSPTVSFSISSDETKAAAADGRVNKAVWDSRANTREDWAAEHAGKRQVGWGDREIRLEGIEGGDLRTVIFLNGSIGTAIYVEPDFTGGPSDFDAQVSHLGLKIVEPAFLSKRFGCLYRTDVPDRYVVAKARESGAPRAVAGVLWARNPKEFSEDSSDLVAWKDLTNSMQRVIAGGDRPAIRDLIRTAQRADSPEGDALLGEIEQALLAGRETTLSAAEAGFSKSGASLADRAASAAVAASVGAEIAGLIGYLPDRLAKSLSNMSRGLAEGASNALVASALREAVDAEALPAHLWGAALAISAIDSWPNLTFTGRAARYREFVEHCAGAPLVEVRKHLAASLAAAALEEAEVAERDGRLAAAAGLYLAAHGFGGGVIDVELMTLATAGNREESSPIDRARRHLAVLTARLLPIPDPAALDPPELLASAYGTDGLLAHLPVQKVAGLTLGSLGESASFASSLGMTLGKFEADPPNASEVSVRVETSEFAVTWLETVNQDNSAEVAKHQEYLAELRRKLREIDGEIGAAQGWVGHTLWQSGPRFEQRSTPGGQIVEHEIDAASRTAREMVSGMESYRDSLAAEHDDLVRNPPPAVLRSTVQREGTHPVEWQIWSGSMARGYRFHGENGITEMGREAELNLRLARRESNEARGITGIDSWITEEDVREGIRRYFDEHLSADASNLLAGLLCDNVAAHANRAQADEAEWSRWFFGLPCGPDPGILMSAAFAPPSPIRLREGWFGETMPRGMRRGPSKRVYLWDTERGLTIEMVYVPPGEFVMGSDEGERNENPRHRCPMPEGVYIGRFETTWREYLAFCSATRRAEPATPFWGILPDHPVVNVNWFDAYEFCRWAGLLLPTEWDWEKAARGDKGQTYPWGDEVVPDVTYSRDRNRRDPGTTGTSRVGSHPRDASPFAAMDMAGNVREWCDEQYDAKLNARSARGDLRRPGPFDLLDPPNQNSDWGKMVLRGGDWTEHAKDQLLSRRFRDDPKRTTSHTIGFRPVKAAEEKK